MPAESIKLSKPPPTFRMNRGSFFAPAIQPKLTVNKPGDMYEQEADLVAEKIMGTASHSSAENFFIPSPKPSVQRKCAHCEEEEEISRKESSTSSPVVTPAVRSTLSSAGQTLDTQTKSFMESRFGYDFGDVRIHNDSLAQKSSLDISAKAYTHGSHIVFGAGEYRPDAVEGKKLLAHELTHVLQQRHSNGILQRKFNFIRPNPVKSINPVTVKFHQDRPIPRGQTAQQTKRNRSLGLTTANIAGKSIISPVDIHTAVNFRLAGGENPPGTFKCRAVTSTTVDVTAEELVLNANRSNKWTGRFSDYPNSQCANKTNIPVTILGDPDANAIEARVLQNEEEHVDDLKNATSDMNARITAIESQEGNGNSQASCQTNLLSKIGNEPGRALGGEFLRRIEADAIARDRRSHTFQTLRSMPSDCARIQFTLKP